MDHPARPNTPLHKPQAGFSAVELLITLFVAAAFLVAGYQLFNAIITAGGNTRAESRAGNVAYEYLRRVSDSASVTNPCTPSSPYASTSIAVEDLSDVTVTVLVDCPSDDTPALSRVTSMVTYNKPAQTIQHVTYVDRSKGAQ